MLDNDRLDNNSPDNNNPDKKRQVWGGISQLFHWLVALLLLIAVLLAFIAGEMDNSPAKLKLFVFHKSVGLAVLLMVVLRLLWRCCSLTPGPVRGISPLNHRLASVGHGLLYFLLLALPLSGWLLNSAANYPFRWMHVIAIPNLPWVMPSWKSVATLSHWYLFLLLALMVSGHIVMVIIHQSFHNSNFLRRMLPALPAKVFFSGFIVCAFTLSASFYYLSRPSASRSGPALELGLESESERTQSGWTVALPPKEIEAQHPWFIIASESKLGFVGDYDGASFNGEFREFTAELYFDPKNLSLAYFDVTIDTRTVTTYTEDFDVALLEEAWFFISAFPRARYRSATFRQTAVGFVAAGTLTLKGVEKSLPLNFQWHPEPNGQVRFTAKAIVNRRDFGIGQGEWAEDETIGFDVHINIDLLLAPQPENGSG